MELAENCPTNDTPIFWEVLNGNIPKSSEIWREQSSYIMKLNMYLL